MPTAPIAVRDITLGRVRTVDDLVRQMRHAGGFVARPIGEAVDILDAMCRDRRCTRFLSFPAAPIATGLRGVIAELLKRKLFDVVITASGSLDHDVARCYRAYHHGDFRLDDTALRRRGLHRLGNILIPLEAYGPLIETQMQKLLAKLHTQGISRLSSSELAWKLGQFLANEQSWLYWTFQHRIPVIIPAVTDGAVGNQLWLYWQRHRDFVLDAFRDETVLSDIVHDAVRTGALLIGGGVTKHHTLWWNQFRGGLDYAVYVTTAVEYDGSLSGALMQEAISWGKLRPRARQVTVHGEATAVLPFIITALLERLTKHPASREFHMAQGSSTTAARNLRNFP